MPKHSITMVNVQIKCKNNSIIVHIYYDILRATIVHRLQTMA